MKMFRTILTVFFISCVCFATPLIPDGTIKATKFATVTDGTTLDQSASGSKLEIKAAGIVPSLLGTITDNSTLDQSGSSSTLEIKSGGVGTSQLAANSVTQAKRAALNIVTSSSSSTFSGSAISPTAVTNLSLSITTTGRPVEICMQADGSASSQLLEVSIASGATATLVLELLRASTVLQTNTYSSSPTGATANALQTGAFPCYIDSPTAGTYTYSVKYNVGSSNTGYVYYFVLIAYEL